MTPGNENIDCLFICIVSYHGTHNVIGQPDTHSLWAIGMPEPKKKFKISVAKSLTTYLHYITAEKRKN